MSRRGRTLADIDTAVRIVTGKSLADITRTAWHVLGSDLAKRIAALEQPDEPLKADYDLVGVSPGCSDRILRAAYKARAQEVHPDHGGSDEAFKAFDEAMDRICKEREIKK